MSLEPMSLARLVAARLCHDIGGLAGTLAGTLDLVDEPPPAPPPEPLDGGAAAGAETAMLDLARETAAALRLRLRLYAALWGGAAEEADARSLGILLEGAPMAPRVGFSLEGIAVRAVLPAPLVPLALAAALAGAEALPRGGTVHLGGDARRGLTVWPQGRGAAWPPALIAALAAPGEAIPGEGCPRRLIAPLLPMIASELGWRASLALGAEAGGVAPLVLAPG